MKLRGVAIEASNGLIFQCTHFDGTPFCIPVSLEDVQLMGEFAQNKCHCWLLVTQEGQQDVRCYIRMPRPSLQFGKFLTVHESQLDSLATSAKDYKPRVFGKSKTIAPVSQNTIEAKNGPIVHSKSQIVIAKEKPVLLAKEQKKEELAEENKNPIADNCKKKWLGFFGKRESNESK